MANGLAVVEGNQEATFAEGPVVIAGEAGQFAVEPGQQRNGLGGTLIQFAENRARELGAKELALDTAVPATHLIQYYERRGYRHVGFAQWKTTNYQSVILSKTL